MQSLKRRLVMGFTVFAMFFGAGNLIFPSFLAYQAGSDVIPAFTGFALSATLLPTIAIIAVTRMGSLEKLADRVHPVFSRILTIIVYLAIGPLLAIPRTASTSYVPRTASTSYEMVAIATNTDSGIAAFVYSALFFTLAALVALKPEKLSKRLGKITSPLLILLIIILFAGTLLNTDAVRGNGTGAYSSSPLSRGFTEGYQTMDAVAGLVFGSIIAMNVRKAGVEEEKVNKECIIAAFTGGFLLLAVYCALAVTGTFSHAFINNASNGAAVLAAAADVIFPSTGKFLIAAIFVLACFNTCTGLLSSCGQYFSTLVPSLSREKWISVFSLISLLTATAGLDTIVRISSPILEIIYPAAITLMILALLRHDSNYRFTWILPVFTSLVFSVLSMITGISFIWIVPVIAAAATGILIDRRKMVRSVH